MKNCIVMFSLLLFVAFRAIAQPVLTQANVAYAAGQTITYYTTTTQVLPGNSGANVTWDLTTIDTSFSIAYYCSNPSDLSNGSSFPGTNMAVGSSGAARYFLIGASGFQLYGSEFGPQLTSYSNPEDLLRFPANFNGSYTDTWKSSGLGSSSNLHQLGTSTVVYDGYGTLQLPGGRTYNNVVRVHAQKTYKDSTVNNGASPTIKNYTSDVYTWYVSGVPGAVATLEERFSTGSYSYWGSFVTDVPTGVDDIRYTLSDLAVYPNPISGGIMNVDFTTNQSEQVKITLACIDGRQLSIAPYNVISGTNRLQIPVAGLSNGIYYLQMTIGDKTVAVKRIAIAR